MSATTLSGYNESPINSMKLSSWYSEWQGKITFELKLNIHNSVHKKGVFALEKLMIPINNFLSTKQWNMHHHAHRRLIAVSLMNI